MSSPHRSVWALTCLLIAAIFVVPVFLGSYGFSATGETGRRNAPLISKPETTWQGRSSNTAGTADPRFQPPVPGPSAPIPVVGFEGLRHGANGPIMNLVTPPDVQVAVGPDHVFEMVNLVGRVSTKGGAAIQTFTLDTFFGAGSADFISDPKVRYDVQSGRWVKGVADGAHQPGVNRHPGLSGRVFDP